MSLDKLFFTKDWTNFSDFLSVETDELKVREDQQFLFNEIRDFLNKKLIPALEALGVETSAQLPENSAGFKYIRLNSDSILQVSSDGKNWLTPGIMTTEGPITPASIGAIPSRQQGAPNGVATLDEDGKVPNEQLPHTTYTKEETLSAGTRAKLGAGDSAVPDDVFKVLPPVGSVFWYAAESAPAGYLACDGSSVAKADYPELYAVIGDTFGAGTDTTFQLPDLRAKFIRGAGSSGNYSAVFGQTQDGSLLVANSFAIRPTVKNPDNEISYSSGCNYGGSGSAAINCYEYGLRPYNIALTPIIKY